jgi:diguanylate cyclase (GGDEF)-like protein/PAS domain S-box-containing protein
VEDVLSLQRDVIADLMRSRALMEGDVNAALTHVTEAASRLLSVRRASVWRFDEARTRIDCLDLFDAMTGQHHQGARILAVDAPSYFEAMGEERCIVAHDARTDPRTSDFTEGYLVPNDIYAMLDAPVLVRGELVGVMCHEQVTTPRRWHVRDELLAGTFADFVGMALGAAEHAVQAKELGILRDGLEVLVEERTRELMQSRENVRTLFETSPVGMLLTGNDGAVLLANQQAGDLFEVAPESARGKSTPDFWVDLEARDQLLAMVRERGLVEGFDTELRSREGRRFWGSVSARALDFDGRPALLIAVQDVTDKKELEKRLRVLATTDDLTRLHNRRHFFELAEPMMKLAERHGWPLSAAMIDVDHFKAINDRYGHAMGDDALRRLANVCREQLRTSDILARYGGEEFVVLFPETDRDAARAAVERMRGALGDSPLLHATGPIHFSVSAGVAQRRDGEKLDDLLRRADEALYAAKGAGRDRVVLAD